MPLEQGLTTTGKLAEAAYESSAGRMSGKLIGYRGRKVLPVEAWEDEEPRKADHFRDVKTTQSDLRSVISNLPPSFFKRAKDRRRMAIEETRSGMRTVVNMIRMERMDRRIRRMPRWELILMAALGLAAIALFASIVFLSINHAR